MQVYTQRQRQGGKLRRALYRRSRARKAAILNTVSKMPTELLGKILHLLSPPNRRRLRHSRNAYISSTRPYPYRGLRRTRKRLRKRGD